MRTFYLFGLMIAVLLTVLGSAVPVFALTCVADAQCAINGTDWCDEFDNQSTYGFGQCTDITELDSQTCNGTDLSCSDDSDCLGWGISACSLFYGVCIGDSEIGGVCRLDMDCPYAHYCRSNICTPATSPYMCSSDSECSSGQTCVDKICRAVAQLGADCNKNSDCLSGMCGSDKVCVECGPNPTDAPEGYYCDIENYDICDSSTLYESTAEINGFAVPRLKLLGEEGDDCHADYCCASNNCDPDLGCLKAGEAPVSTGGISDFCVDYPTRDLYSEWFDGATGYATPPVLSVFNSIFNHTNLTVIIPYENLTSINITHYAYYREASTGLMLMMAWFYDPVSEEVCYFKQENNDIYWKCIDQILTRQDGSNSTVSFINESFSAESSEAVITSTGAYATGPSGCSTRFGASIAFLHLIKPTEGYIDIMSFILGSESSPTCTSYGWLNFYNPTAGNQFVSVSNNRYDGGYVVIYNTAQSGKGTSYDKRRIASMSQIYTSEPASKWGLATAIATGAVKTWSEQFVYSFFDYDTIICCQVDSDCPAGLCCYSSMCSECIYTYSTTLILSTPKQTVSINESAIITAHLTDSNGDPVSGKLIQFIQDPVLGVLKLSCTTTSNGKCTTYFYSDSIGSTTITGTFAGDSTYYGSIGKQQITVSNLSNYIQVLVVEYLGGLIPTPVPGVAVYNDSLSPATKWSSADTNYVVTWSGLPSTPTSYKLTFSKAGYITSYYNVPINTPLVVVLERSTGGGATEEPLPDFTITTPIPQNVEEVTSGLSELVRTFLARPFLWVLFIIMLLLAIAITKGVILYAFD